MLKKIIMKLLQMLQLYKVKNYSYKFIPLQILPHRENPIFEFYLFLPYKYEINLPILI